MSKGALTAALALAACAPEDSSAPVDACPLDAPVRLIAPPERPQPGGSTELRYQILGDYILYTFDRYDHPAPAFWRIHRCGGEPESLHSAPLSLRSFTALGTADNFVLYGADQSGKPYFLGRLDAPGFDEPPPVLGLPDEQLRLMPTELGLVLRTARPYESTGLSPVAAIGARVDAAYVHRGDPKAPAVKLGEDVLSWHVLGDRLLVHSDDGALRSVDPDTGQSELVLADVRHVQLAAAARRLIWQQIGDDLAEPIFLRDLDTGADVQIAVNDFTDVSWNRPNDLNTRNTGTWMLTGDGAHAALYGPGHALAAVVRLDTGAPVTPPADVFLFRSSGHEFDLEVDDHREYVRVLWDPRTGALREWYRGPVAGSAPYIFDRAEDHLDYAIYDSAYGGSQTVWRLDFATGEATVHIPRLGSLLTRLDDGRYVTAWSPSFFVLERELVVFDPDTRRYTNIADISGNFTYFPDQGLFVANADGRPGLWALPIPER